MKSVEIYRCKLVREGSLEYNKKTMRDCADVMKMIVDLGLDEMTEEYFGMFCLNVKGEIVAFHEVSHGELSATNCHPREIYKRALLNNAAGVIVFHNHPSGDISPSADDITATKRIEEVGKIMGIKLIDHLIVSEGRYCSLKVEGVLS